MRALRYVLRLIFALEALGFLSLAFYRLRQSTFSDQPYNALHLGAKLDSGAVLVPGLVIAAWTPLPHGGWNTAMP